MDEKIIGLLKEKPLIIPRILINNYKKLGITDSELIILMLFISCEEKTVYNPEKMAKEINDDKHNIMKIVNSLITKNIVSFEVEKRNNKAFEYISLDLLYEKLFNLLIDIKKDKKIEISVFDTFEKELGRTLSPMEYEQIKEWINDEGNTEEMITCALKEAVLNGVSNFRYIDSILNEWKKKGYKSKKDIVKDREEYHSKKSKISVYDTDWLNDK